MGVVRVDTGGSFPVRTKVFSAEDHGHAAAVGAAIAWLAGEVMTAAIAQDHRLHAEGAAPAHGFGREADSPPDTNQPAVPRR